MLIADKDRHQFVNSDQCMAIFVSQNGRIIASTAMSGKNCILDEYASRDEAMVAMQMLLLRLENAPPTAQIVRMPTDDEVQTQLNKSDAPYRLSGGRKQKGHGGS